MVHSEPLAPRRWKRVLVGAALAVNFALGASYVYRTSFVHDGRRVFCLWDDAMVSMQYAANLVSGDGLVWNPGERVQGISNPGVTVLMAAIHQWPVSPERTSLLFQLVNLGALAAISALVVAIASLLFPDRPALVAAAALSIFLAGALHVWSLQGSDVGLVTLWLCGAVWCYLRAIRRGRAWPRELFALLALGLVLRPDTAVFYLVFLGFAARGTGGRLRLLAGTATLAGVLGALAAVGIFYYGDPLPNTFYLKLTGSPRELVMAEGLRQLAWVPGLVVGLALAALGAADCRTRRGVPLLAWLVLAGLAYNQWIGGDWKIAYGSRFLMPIVPPLLILACAGLWRLSRSLATPLRTPTFIAAASVFAIFASPARARLEWFDPRVPTMGHEDNAANYAEALYFRRYTSSDTTIGLHWAGVPRYFGGRNAVDLLGKSDRHIAKRQVPRFYPGHSKWDWDYVLKVRRPHVIATPTRGLEDRPDFQRDYQLLGTPGGRTFFMRRDAAGQLLDQRAQRVEARPGLPGEVQPPAPAIAQRGVEIVGPLRVRGG